MKRLLTAFLCLTLLAGLLPLTAIAEGQGWYMVDSTSPKGYAYLYSAASDRDEKSRNLGKYVNGETVYVLDYYGGQEGKYNYCYVRTQDGKTGYMHDSALKRTNGSGWDDTSAGWYEVASTSPNGYAYLYSAASDRDEKSYNKGRYDNGERVYVVDYYGGQDGQYNYCYVQTEDGKTGYMHDSALKRISETDEGWYIVASTSPKGYAYLYSAASDRSAKSYNKGRYDNGEMVYVLNYYGGQDGPYNFCYVQTQDGKTGYMHDGALQPYGVVTPSSKLNALPSLTYQCRGTVISGNASVFTGPSTAYYRTASGKAYVAKGATMTIYGREGNYYLVQYTGTNNGQAVTRCSFLHASRLTPGGSVAELDLAWLPIRIEEGAHLADAPDFSHSYNTIAVDLNSAYALAQITDASGNVWVYFESTGYANTIANQGTVSIRGFVPMSDVSLR